MKTNRTILIVLILILSYNCSSYKKNLIASNTFNRIKKIKFKSENDTIHKYVNLLNLKDPNSLILNTSYSSHWTKGNLYSRFLVYQNNGLVYRYITILSTNKNKIKRKKIKKSNLFLYWNFLNNCISENRFNINQNRLNINKTYNNDGTYSYWSISDGTNYQLEIIYGKKSTFYHSYAPELFIQDKLRGWKDRKKLVDLMVDIDCLVYKKRK